MDQVEMVSLENLVSKDHTYRKFKEIFDFGAFKEELESIEIVGKYKGYGSERLFKICLLQFMEDLSDRQMERYMADNVSAKWFCGFRLIDQTPDHTVLSRYRARLGTKKLSNIFRILKAQLASQGLMNETFTFIDASHLISKANLWQERDKAIKANEDKLDNKNLQKFSNDKQARIGCKGKDKFWHGYKRHMSVDMSSGLINKVAVTPANITDAKAIRHVLPKTGAIYADKGYACKENQALAKAKKLKLNAIKKNNAKDKDKDFDKWVSKIRAPYERVFSKSSNKVRYLGTAKNQFAEFFKAMSFNLKRLLVLNQQHPDFFTQANPSP